MYASVLTFLNTLAKAHGMPKDADPNVMNMAVFRKVASEANPSTIPLNEAGST